MGKVGVDYIGVSVIFLCHDGKGKVLLHKRSNKCRDEIGRWDNGGGALEFGEELEQGVKREVKEEYGCRILDLKLLGVRNVLRKNGKIGTHWLAVLYAALVNPKKAKLANPEKMDQIGWFDLDHLPEPLHSGSPYLLDLAKRAGII